MDNKNFRNISWLSLSRLIIIVFLILQIARWRILPQFMDIYYHFLTAWGFIQAGGWSGWDFWQYAPVGRMHIYPPLFHIILAFLIKLGANKVILAKVFETLTPVAFLFVTHRFVRRNYSERLAFFVLLTVSSSFSFFMNLINHVPSTLAMILGILAFGALLQRKKIRAAVFLALCFYTHIGISWFFALAVVFYSLFYKEERKGCLLVLFYALLFSSPMIFKEAAGLRVVQRFGMNLSETAQSQFKVLECVLALLGLAVALKSEKKYRFFVGLFLASLIFLPYPYRFFSAEGYLAVIFLSAVFLDKAWGIVRKNNLLFLKYGLFFLIIFLFIFSPAVSTDQSSPRHYKFTLFDSAFIGMALPEYKDHPLSRSIWFPDDYLPAADFITNNSQAGDIVYCSINILGISLASLAGRSTANGLFMEIDPQHRFDPFAVSRIIVFASDDDPVWVSGIEKKYGLLKVAENKIFKFYKNPKGYAQMAVKTAGFSFAFIIIAAAAFISLGLIKNI